MATDTVQIGVGMGGLAIEQWRSFADRIASIPIDIQILGLQGPFNKPTSFGGVPRFL